jgi:hypothetical protein
MISPDAATGGSIGVGNAGCSRDGITRAGDGVSTEAPVIAATHVAAAIETRT